MNGFPEIGSKSAPHSSDSVVVNWTSFGSKLSSNFGSLYESREKTGDVTVICGGEFLKAHQLVLSMGSKYFQDVFQTSPSRHPTVLLKDISAPTMNQLLKCLYLGKVTLAQDEVSDFRKGVDELEMFEKSVTLQSIPNRRKGQALTKKPTGSTDVTQTNQHQHPQLYSSHWNIIPGDLSKDKAKTFFSQSSSSREISFRPYFPITPHQRQSSSTRLENTTLSTNKVGFTSGGECKVLAQHSKETFVEQLFSSI